MHAELSHAERMVSAVEGLIALPLHAVRAAQIA